MYKHSKGSRGSTTSDTTPSTQSFAILKSCKCHVQDVVIIVLAVLILLICLVASLISYYVVYQADLNGAFSKLQQTQLDTAALIKIQMNDAYKKLKPLASVVQYSTSLNYKNQFVPIMDSGNVPFLQAIICSDRVSASDVATYNSNMRSRGGYYSNFAVHSDASSPTALNAADEYYPIVLSYFPGAIGVLYNSSNEIALLGADQVSQDNKATVALVNSTLLPAVTDVVLTLGGTDSKGTQLYLNSTIGFVFPITDSSANRLTGIFTGFIGVEDVIQQVFTDPSVIVTIIDTNRTTVNGGLIYNSLNYANIKDVNKLRSAARFNAASNFTVSTRQYQLILSSTDDYVTQKSATARWVGPIFAIIIFIVAEFLCLALFFFLRLRLSLKERKKSKRAINALKDGHERTKLLLHRLAKQEAKARATVDAVPFFVIILNATGRILHTNKNFDKIFGYSESQLQQGLHITTVVPTFTANIFCEPKYSSDESDVFIRAIASSNMGEDLDVRCVVKNLFSTGLSRIGSNSSVGTPVTPMTPMSPNDFTDEAGEEDEAFAVIGTAVSLEVTDSFDLRKKTVNNVAEIKI